MALVTSATMDFHDLGEFTADDSHLGSHGVSVCLDPTKAQLQPVIAVGEIVAEVKWRKLDGLLFTGV